MPRDKFRCKHGIAKDNLGGEVLKEDIINRDLSGDDMLKFMANHRPNGIDFRGQRLRKRLQEKQNSK